MVEKFFFETLVTGHHDGIKLALLTTENGFIAAVSPLSLRGRMLLRQLPDVAVVNPYFAFLLRPLFLIAYVCK